MTKLMHIPKLQRMHFIQTELSRLDTPPPEPPEVTARKAQEARERLARHDRMFGVYPGVTLGAEPPWEAVDPEGDAELG